MVGGWESRDVLLDRGIDLEVLRIESPIHPVKFLKICKNLSMEMGSPGDGNLGTCHPRF